MLILESFEEILSMIKDDDEIYVVLSFAGCFFWNLTVTKQEF